MHLSTYWTPQRLIHLERKLSLQVDRAKQRRISVGRCIDAILVAYRFEWFGNCCAYCGGKAMLEIDHIHALHTGGLHALHNLAPACRMCNRAKGIENVSDWYKRQPFFNKERLAKIETALSAAIPIYPAESKRKLAPARSSS